MIDIVSMITGIPLAKVAESETMKLLNMANELKNARPPSNIMIKARNISTSNDMYSGAKRNKPCPCGSEKKYKFCHGA